MLFRGRSTFKAREDRDVPWDILIPVHVSRTVLVCKHSGGHLRVKVVHCVRHLKHAAATVSVPRVVDA